MTQRIDEIMQQADEQLDQWYKEHGDNDGGTVSQKPKKNKKPCKHPGCPNQARTLNDNYCPLHKTLHNPNNLLSPFCKNTKPSNVQPKDNK
jgi:hypothetical protein